MLHQKRKSYKYVLPLKNWVDWIKLDGMPTRIKLKIQACFTFYLKFWGGTSAKSCKIQLPVLLFLVLHQFLYQKISFFYNFLELHSTLFEKDFVTGFPFLMDSPKPPTPLIAKSAKYDKSFLSILPKMPSEIFYKNIDKTCKSIFYVSAVNCYCTFFLKVPTTDCGSYLWCYYQNIF